MTSSRVPQLAVASVAPQRTMAPRPTFEQVYETQFEMVRRAVRRCGVAPHAVDDVAQQVFVVVLRRLGEFDGRSKLSTWLFGIVLRVVGNHRRANRRRLKAMSSAALVASDMELLAANDSPLDQAEGQQAVRIARDLFNEMSVEQAMTFWMYELLGYSVPEIAQEVSVSANTVTSRLRYARIAFARLAAKRYRSHEVTPSTGFAS